MRPAPRSASRSPLVLQIRPYPRSISSGYPDQIDWIGVGNGARHPLPPNPVCGSPATGSPVSCFRIGIGAPIDGLQTS